MQKAVGESVQNCAGKSNAENLAGLSCGIVLLDPPDKGSKIPEGVPWRSTELRIRISLLKVPCIAFQSMWFMSKALSLSKS